MQTKCRHLIYNGGFPINFDRSIEWEDPFKISLTRGLILSAILQAISFSDKICRDNLVMLSPLLQRILVNHWLAYFNFDARIFKLNNNTLAETEWYQNESIGHYYSLIDI